MVRLMGGAVLALAFVVAAMSTVSAGATGNQNNTNFNTTRTKTYLPGETYTGRPGGYGAPGDRQGTRQRRNDRHAPYVFGAAPLTPATWSLGNQQDRRLLRLKIILNVNQVT